MSADKQKPPTPPPPPPVRFVRDNGGGKSKSK